MTDEKNTFDVNSPIFSGSTGKSSMASNDANALNVAKFKMKSCICPLPSTKGNDIDNSEKQSLSQTLEENRFNDWDDSRLKNLLEEAYSYKNPRDKENKSEIFLQLLQNAESEKEEQNFKFHAIASRYDDPNSNSHTQGGSLQDLVDKVRSETLLDCDYNVGGSRNRRHNHNSRPKKYSSVSSRQREGGSLPSNVNVSNFSAISAMSAFDYTKKSKANENSSVSTNAGIIGDDISIQEDSILESGVNMNISKGFCADIAGTQQERMKNNKNNETEQQEIEISKLNEFDEQVVKENIVKIRPTSAGFAPSDSQCYVDELVHFSTLERGKLSNDSNYIALDESYKSCKSVLGEKLDLIATQSTIFTSTKIIPKQLDENGNALFAPYNSNQSQAKLKKKKLNYERNTKTLDLESVAGYRGQDPIEVLVKYIENSQDRKQNERVSKIVESKKKDKKKDKEKQEKEKDVKTKIKKSSSLEELISCSKLYSEENIDSTAMNKCIKNKKNESNKSIEIEKEKVISYSNNKAERRSWGTEELTYLGRNKINDEIQDKIKDKEKRKFKIKDLEKLPDEAVNIEMNDKLEHLTGILPESVLNESAEFHVVTKKKKQRKKQCPTSPVVNLSNNVAIHRIRSDLSSQRNVRNSNFSNTHEAYFNSLNNTEKFRRKSASSVPPSEISDSSDLDSVHSLPIETTIAGNMRHKLVSKQEHSQPQSYADIARINETEVITNTIASFITTSDKKFSPLGMTQGATSIQDVAAFKTKKTPKTDHPDLNDEFNTTKVTSCTTSLTNINTLSQLPYLKNFTPGNNSFMQPIHKNGEIFINKGSYGKKNVEISNITTSDNLKKKPTGSLPKSKTNIKDYSNANQSVVKCYNYLSKQQVKISNHNEETGNLVLDKIDTELFETDNVRTNISKKEKPSQNILCEDTLICRNSNNNKGNLIEVEPEQQTQIGSSKNCQRECLEFPSVKSHLTMKTRQLVRNKSSCWNKSNANERSINLRNCNNTSNTISKCSSRPPVVILNDDKKNFNISSISNEFTFGDFNKDELKLFSDENQQIMPSLSLTPITSLPNDANALTGCNGTADSPNTNMMIIPSSDVANNLSIEFQENSEDRSPNFFYNREIEYKDLKTQVPNSETLVITNNINTITKALSPQPVTDEMTEDGSKNHVDSKRELKTYNQVESTMIRTVTADPNTNDCTFEKNQIMGKKFCSLNSLPPRKLIIIEKVEKSSANDRQCKETLHIDECQVVNSLASLVQLSIKKEDLHKDELYFISPATPPISIQNKIIIDFIESAWEEVSNSKVTQFYNGQ